VAAQLRLTSIPGSVQGKAAVARSSGSGQSGTAGITRGMSLEEIIAAAGWVQRHAAQVSRSGQWRARTLGCEPDGFMSARFNPMQIAEPARGWPGG